MSDLAIAKADYFAYRLATQVNFTITTSSGAFTAWGCTLNFEVEEAGIYEVGSHINLQTGGGSSPNEINAQLQIDGHRIRGRRNISVYNTTVKRRSTGHMTRQIYLAEGGHVLALGLWSFNTAGVILTGSDADDCCTLWVRKKG